MAKPSKTFICQNCGAVSSRWVGKCNSCGEWDSFVEEISTSSGIASGPKSDHSQGNIIQLEDLKGTVEDAPRIASGLEEFDRVTGGGLVPGSALLVGGDPGIGKSTLLLQLAAKLADSGHGVIYFSGEEATAQVRLRAERLKVSNSNVKLAAETNLSNILSTLENGPAPDLIIIDSIQTLWTDLLEAAPGTVSQVRSCAQALIRIAKKHQTTLIMIGHVTKDGNIAGPKVVEHMVDAVLYFEGDKGYNFRLIRSMKNRFGATDEIGVFEMGDEGLAQVSNPSELFLGEREDNTVGSVVFAGMEGTRPILVEIQALVAPTNLGTPRRAVVGWDSNRLAMILAVLDAHCNMKFGSHDVYLNVAGGLRITDPAADLAVASALISSIANIAIAANGVYFGEVSLSGALRSVSQMPARLKEAKKLGFVNATIPSQGKIEKLPKSLSVARVTRITDLTRIILN